MPTAKYPVPKFLLEAANEAHMRLEACKSAMETTVQLATRGALDGVAPVEGAALRLNLPEGVVEVVTPDPVAPEKPTAPALPDSTPEDRQG